MPPLASTRSSLSKRGTKSAKASRVAVEESVFQFLTFVVSNEMYGLPLSSVREILRPPPITRVPRAPHDILGIVSVRGRVTTVIDLRRRFGGAPDTSSKQMRVLLVDGGTEVIGLQVDAVLQVCRLTANQIEPPSVLGSDSADYIYGIGRPGAASSSAEPGASAAPKLLKEKEKGQGEIVVLLEPKTLLSR